MSEGFKQIGNGYRWRDNNFRKAFDQVPPINIAPTIQRIKEATAHFPPGLYTSLLPVPRKQQAGITCFAGDAIQIHDQKIGIIPVNEMQMEAAAINAKL